MNSKSKGLRIYSWTRFIVFLTVLVLIAFIAGGLVFQSTVSANEETVFDTIMISDGDTLWEIAHEYSDGNDVRNLVQEICSVNEISAGDIYPGQTIKVPVAN